MGIEHNQPGVTQVDNLSEKRLWKALDSISERLTGIETHLSKIVRLEEQVNNHNQTLSRVGNKLEDHDARLRDTEMWQAHRRSVEQSFINAQEEIKLIKTKIDALETSGVARKVENSAGKEILKWAGSIVAAILIFAIIGGSK